MANAGVVMQACEVDGTYQDCARVPARWQCLKEDLDTFQYRHSCVSNGQGVSFNPSNSKTSQTWSSNKNGQQDKGYDGQAWHQPVPLQTGIMQGAPAGLPMEAAPHQGAPLFFEGPCPELMPWQLPMQPPAHQPQFQADPFWATQQQQQQQQQQRQHEHVAPPWPAAADVQPSQLMYNLPMYHQQQQQEQHPQNVMFWPANPAPAQQEGTPCQPVPPVDCAYRPENPVTGSNEDPANRRKRRNKRFGKGASVEPPLGNVNSFKTKSGLIESKEQAVPAPNQKPSSFHEDFELTARIGKGGFAQVYSAIRTGGACTPYNSISEAATTCSSPLLIASPVWEESDARRDEEEVAVKITDLRGLATSSSPQDWKRLAAAEKEVAMLKKVSGFKNCVQLISVYNEDQLSYIVMERCPMTLLQALESLPRYSETQIKTILAEMLEGLQALHSRNIVHRDVKPDNFLSTGDTIKLCDFGLAEVCQPNKSPLRHVYGTAPFMSPEMLLGQGYDMKTDIWSFGVLAYLLLLGQFPYKPPCKNPSDVKIQIASGVPEPTFRSRNSFVCSGAIASPGATCFLTRVLCRDQRKRPSAGTAAGIAWLRLQDGDGARRAPCLRPVLETAKRCGAFTLPQNAVKVCDIDHHLGNLQKQVRGSSAWANTLAPLPVEAQPQKASKPPQQQQQQQPQPPSQQQAPSSKVAPTPAPPRKYQLCNKKLLPSKKRAAAEAAAEVAEPTEPVFEAFPAALLNDQMHDADQQQTQPQEHEQEQQQQEQQEPSSDSSVGEAYGLLLHASAAGFLDSEDRSPQSSLPQADSTYQVPPPSEQDPMSWSNEGSTGAELGSDGVDGARSRPRRNFP